MGGAGNPLPPSVTVCKTDTVYTQSNLHDPRSPNNAEPIESDTTPAITEDASEQHHHDDDSGTYAHYQGHNQEHVQHDQYQSDGDVEEVRQYEVDEHEHEHEHHHHHYNAHDENKVAGSTGNTLTQRQSVATTANSFDQIGHEVAEDLEVFEHVEEHELQNLAELIPERNQDRLFSEADPAPEPSSIARSESQNLDEEIAQVFDHNEDHNRNHLDVQKEDDCDRHRHYEHHEDHDHQQYHDHHEPEEAREHEHRHSFEGEDGADMAREVIPEVVNHKHHHHHHHLHETEDETCGCNDATTVAGDEVSERALPGAAPSTHNVHVHTGSNNEETNNDEGHDHHNLDPPPGFPGGHDDDDSTFPGPPPSFRIRGERLSRNVADAMSVIWDKFWSEDVRQIVRIIKNRFGQLMPYVRRFLAHLVAFWGGITYIRRAITAFIRLLKRDERVRELLERLGWACATTMRVFLSMCAMLMQASLQCYHLMRDRIIPDTRRVVPILHYKMILKLLSAAKHSPWSLWCGPFSLTFAIDSDKVPDRYFLHDRLYVDREDVSFASMSDVVHSIRESVYYHRSRAAHHESEHHDDQEEHGDGHEYEEEHHHEHEHRSADEHAHHHHEHEHSSADEHAHHHHEHVHAHKDEHAHAHDHDHDHDHDHAHVHRGYEHENAENAYEENKEDLTIISTSSPVHTNSTNEAAVAPPSGYSGPMYHHSKHGLSKRLSNGPLSERTNLGGER